LASSIHYGNHDYHIAVIVATQSSGDFDTVAGDCFFQSAFPITVHVSMRMLYNDTSLKNPDYLR